MSKAVICVPSSLVRNWAAEFRKWLGSVRTQPIVCDQGGKAAAKEGCNAAEERKLRCFRPLSSVCHLVRAVSMKKKSSASSSLGLVRASKLSSSSAWSAPRAV